LAREAFDAFSEEVEAVRTAVEAWQGADLDSTNSQLSSLHEALQAASEGGFPVPGLDSLSEIVDLMGRLQDEMPLDSESMMAFVEAYEELESALDEYDGLREGDRYEGRRDDMDQAWDQVTEKMEGLAEAADVLGFDPEPSESPVEAS
jgi:hypothetical protein